MFKCERKRLIECHRLGQATLVLVSQYEVRKLHSKAAERCEGWKAAAVPKGNMQLCSTCTCPSVAPRGKSSSTPSFSLLPQLLFLDTVSSGLCEIREENGKQRTLNASKLPLLLYCQLGNKMSLEQILEFLIA